MLGSSKNFGSSWLSGMTLLDTDQAEMDRGLVHLWTRRGSHDGVVVMPLLTKRSGKRIIEEFTGSSSTNLLDLWTLDAFVVFS